MTPTFAFILQNRSVFVDNIRVRGIGRHVGIQRTRVEEKGKPTPVSFTDTFFALGRQRTPVYLLNDLGYHEKINGPAIIMNDTSTILVEPECSATITEYVSNRLRVTAVYHL